MSAHMVTMLYGTDLSWLPEYRANVPQMVRANGGAYEILSEGQVERPEGTMEIPHTVAVFRFPSREAITNFFASEEYRPYKELRNRYTRTEILMFDDRELTGPHAG